MAWTHRTSTLRLDRGEGAWAEEYLVFTQIPSTDTGHVRYKVESYYNYGGDDWRLRDNIYVHLPNDEYQNNWCESPAGELDGAHSTTTVSIPKSWVGQTVVVMGTAASDAEWQIVLDADAPCLLSVTLRTGVQSVTVNRSASRVGATGSLTNGAIIYVGDVLAVDAVPVPGYILDPIASPITVSDSVYLAPTASLGATMHLWNGNGWDLYLIYIYTDDGWAMCQFNVWNGTAWEPYF